MLTFMSADPTQHQQTITSLNGQAKVIVGRACGFSVIESIRNATNYLHSLAGMAERSPAKSPRVRELTKSLKSVEDPQGADSYSTEVFFPALYDAIFNRSEAETGLLTLEMKVSYFLRALYCHNFFSRPVEVCDYCPLITDIKFPTSNNDFDSDGFPKFIIVQLRRWKSKRNPRPYDMFLHRNYLNPKFCPVFWLIFWIRISRITRGPIFPDFDAHGKVLIATKVGRQTRLNGHDFDVYLTDSNVVVNTSYTTFDQRFRTLFKLSGFPTLSLYSFRKSGVKWAALCGAPDWALKNTGRWAKVSNHFYVYIEEGYRLGDLAKLNNSIHPIRRFWVYKPTTFVSELNSQL